MNEIDLKICEIFPSQRRKQIMENIYGIWIPELHDVLRFAEDLWIEFKCMRFQSSSNEYTLQFEDKKQVFDLITYDPFIPLIKQSDETKNSLISLFI